jgi:hypothetical protein
MINDLKRWSTGNQRRTRRGVAPSASPARNPVGGCRAGKPANEQLSFVRPRA